MLAIVVLCNEAHVKCDTWSRGSYPPGKLMNLGFLRSSLRLFWGKIDLLDMDMRVSFTKDLELTYR